MQPRQWCCPWISLQSDLCKDNRVAVDVIKVDRFYLNPLLSAQWTFSPSRCGTSLSPSQPHSAHYCRPVFFSITSEVTLVMSLVRCSLFLLAAISAVMSTELGLGRRSQLDARQQCRNAGWIPACPGMLSSLDGVIRLLIQTQRSLTMYSTRWHLLLRKHLRVAS
jgi:hypothetical protein